MLRRLHSRFCFFLLFFFFVEKNVTGRGESKTLSTNGEEGLCRRRRTCSSVSPRSPASRGSCMGECVRTCIPLEFLPLSEAGREQKKAREAGARASVHRRERWRSRKKTKATFLLLLLLFLCHAYLTPHPTNPNPFHQNDDCTKYKTKTATTRASSAAPPSHSSPSATSFGVPLAKPDPTTN